jgi:hypothetical protein
MFCTQADDLRQESKAMAADKSVRPTLEEDICSCRVRGGYSDN